MAKTGRQSFQQMLRLTEELRELLRESAEKNNRSMNAEIVSRLEGTFDVFTSNEEIMTFTQDVALKNAWVNEILSSVKAANEELRQTTEEARREREAMRTNLKFIDMLGNLEGLNDTQQKKLQNFIDEELKA